MIEVWRTYKFIPCNQQFLNVTRNGTTAVCNNSRCYKDGYAVLDEYKISALLIFCFSKAKFDFY